MHVDCVFQQATFHAPITKTRCFCGRRSKDCTQTHVHHKHLIITEIKLLYMKIILEISKKKHKILENCLNLVNSNKTFKHTATKCEKKKLSKHKLYSYINFTAYLKMNYQIINF